MPRKQLSVAEFVPMMALLTALDAMSIDMMLPALAQIGRDLGVTGTNDAQLVITFMFLGFALGQIIGGPLSDSIGRKPATYWGLAIYVLGTLIAIFATSFPVMLGARLLQGIGASIPLVVMVALVRDLYEGAPMARIMSFIGSVFIIVPILAPLIGQGILLVAHWRMIFVTFVILAIPASVWFMVRQPETLPVDRRLPLSLQRVALAVVEVCSIRVSLGYILAEGLLFGAFLGYLNSTQQIFQDIYGAGPTFVLYFSSLALAIGVSLYVNGRLVERFGMQRMTRLGFLGLAGLSLAFLPVALAYAGAPPLWLLMTYLLTTFFFVGFLFGNLNALTMEPLGHIAGVGAAVVGLLTTLIGLPIGTLIGYAFDRSIVPVIVGFAVLGILAGLCMSWAEHRRPAATAI